MLNGIWIVKGKNILDDKILDFNLYGIILVKVLLIFYNLGA